MAIPVIDLFAGPGGLGEGFASLTGHTGEPFFDIALSIEKTEVAHRTLTLRAVFRRLRDTEHIEDYYSFVRGDIDETTFRALPSVKAAFEHASKEARCLELGKSDEALIDADIRKALGGNQTWILIGGPPCQAYSLAGRSRRANDKNFHKDEKHFLYQEYLRIIQQHRPTVFVMENVKGMLSSKHSGNSIFERIITDLSSPAPGLEYEIRSFTKSGNSDCLAPTDYLIHSEEYGIPQARHRVILLGVRKGLGAPKHQLLKPVPSQVTVAEAIGDLPRIRSKLSRGDSVNAWREAVENAFTYLKGWNVEAAPALTNLMREYAGQATSDSTGGRFLPITAISGATASKSREYTELQRWLFDRNLGGVSQHEARAHMASDLARYLFASTFAREYRYSPRLDVFPPRLLPDHINVPLIRTNQSIPFKDRFRVQCAHEPATTVVSHIAKDGHYYIHYDPSQCRSLTVREAARLQTFPDNYFFAGNRTEQYTQVGNAVPPFLACKLAKIVRNLLLEMNRKNRRRGTQPLAHQHEKKKIRSNADDHHGPLLVETD